jgi:hypothetical protein
MWKGFEMALGAYGKAVCAEWIRRGYQDTTREKIESLLQRCPKQRRLRPCWLGDERLHASHRSSLLRKLPEHYSRFGWKEPDDMPYFWPSKDGANHFSRKLIFP